MLLDDGMVFDDTLPLCLKEVQLLDKVCIVLVVLSVLVDIRKESPVIEVIDGILKNGVGGLITPEATLEPGGEWLQWFVRGLVRRSVQLNDSCLLLSFGLTV